MRGAHGLAFAAAQAVFHRIRNRADVARFKNQRFAAEQSERRRVGMAQIATGQQFAFVETTFRINFFFVALEWCDFLVGQEFQFGQPNAVLTRDDAVERARKRHDARNGRIGLLQHFVVVAVDGNVGVHIAVAGMHVQRDPNASAQHLFVNCFEPINDGFERFARENVFQRCFDLGAPRHANFVRLQRTEIRINVVEQVLPIRTNARD